MAYLPYDISTETTVDPTHIQANDAALDNAISGNLTETAFSSATRMPNSTLASPNVEEIITLRWGGPTGTALAVSATQPIDCVPIPASNIVYTILRASYTYFGGPGAAGAAGSISINFGTIVANNWNNVTTLVNAVALTATTGANQTVTGNFALAASTFTAATTPSQIAALCTVASGGGCTPRLVVTLVVTRALQ